MNAQMNGKTRYRERFSFEDLRRECEGQWGTIVTALSEPDISEALDTRKHVICHRGHSKKKHFRLFKDFDQTGGGICTCGNFGDGFKLFEYLNGWDRKTAVREVGKFLRDRGYKPNTYRKPPAPPAPKPLVVDKDNASALKELWREARPIHGTLAERYFRDRGIGGELPNTGDIGFHPRLHYWDSDTGESLGHFPGIVSILRSSRSGHPLTIHRTYLDRESGKAKVPNAKKLMPVAVPHAISEAGGAIRLYHLDGPVLGIAEGIETAAAVHAAHPELPMWAAGNAPVLASFMPPASVKHVYIFGDVDTSGTGQVVSARLAMKLEAAGIKATICLPAKSVSLPCEGSPCYSKEVTKQKVVQRLCKAGYFPANKSQDVDWLDVWNTSKDVVISAIHGPLTTR